jgi:hypothetical protein
MAKFELLTSTIMYFLWALLTLLLWVQIGIWLRTGKINNVRFRFAVLFIPGADRSGPVYRDQHPKIFWPVVIVFVSLALTFGFGLIFMIFSNGLWNVT